MDLTSDDLEDCVEKFRSTFLNHKCSKRNETDLLLLIENLTEDLKLSKKNEETIQSNFRLLLESEDSKITKKYVTLEGKFREREAEVIELKKRLDELNTQMPIELEAQKNEYNRKMKESEEYFNQEITNLKIQIESAKICYETKENEFQNELQAFQAAAALQYDENESNLQRQLVDANSKLRQSQNTIRSLQLEINNMNNQMAQQKYNNTPVRNILNFKENPIQAIRNNIAQQHSESIFRAQENESEYEFDGNVRPSSTYSLCSSTTKVVEFQKNANQSAFEKSTCITSQNQNRSRSLSQNRTHQDVRARGTETYSTAKYPPLPLHHSPPDDDDDDEERQTAAQKFGNNHRPVVPHKGARQTIPKNKNRNNYLPPLMPCTDKANTGKKFAEENKPRKRKLYDPDNLTYLQSLMENDE